MNNIESKDILQIASDLVNGDRQQQYSHPSKDFTRVAKMMSGLGFRFDDLSTGIREIKASDVPLFMVLVKLSREVHKHKEDNLVDCVGYIKTLDMVIKHEEENKGESNMVSD